MMENPSSTKSLIKTIAFSILIPAVALLIAWGYVHKISKSGFWFNEGWYETFTLKNGMEVIVIPNHKIPAVSHMIWYKVGAMEDPVGKSGIAHFLEHLMFKGTAAHPNGEFSKLVEQNGGHENAFTAHDYTGYYQNISKDKLPLMMEIESDRMRGLLLKEDEVEHELQVILEERKMRFDNQPRALLKEQMDAALYQGHPYATQAIGWQKDMEGLTRADALDFYHKYYAPNNAILVVSGDITAKELEPLARKYYGRITPNTKLPERENFDLPPQIAAREIEIADARVKDPEFWRAYVAPNYGNGEEAENFYALVLLSKIMGEGNLSRLYGHMVIDKKIATMAGSDYTGLTRGPGEFDFYAIPANGVTVAELRSAIDAQVKKVVESGVTEEELALAKKSLIAEQTYAHEGLQSMGTLVGELAVLGIEPDFVTSFPDRINAVTAEQLQNVAQQVFKPENSVTGILKIGDK